MKRNYESSDIAIINKTRDTSSSRKMLIKYLPKQNPLKLETTMQTDRRKI